MYSTKLSFSDFAPFPVLSLSCVSSSTLTQLFPLCQPWNWSPPSTSSVRAMGNTTKTSWLAEWRTGVGEGWSWSRALHGTGGFFSHFQPHDRPSAYTNPCYCCTSVIEETNRKRLTCQGWRYLWLVLIITLIRTRCKKLQKSFSDMFKPTIFSALDTRLEASILPSSDNMKNLQI